MSVRLAISASVRRSRLWSASLMSLCLLGCGERGSASEGGAVTGSPDSATPGSSDTRAPDTRAPDASSALGDQSLPLGFDGITTPGQTAAKNLGAQIDGVEGQLTRQPTSLALMTQVIDLRLTRTQFLGTYSDFARAKAIAAEAVRVHGEQGRILMARVDTALHAFEQATAALQAAGAMRPEQAGTLALATGADLAPHLAAARAAVQQSPTYGNYTHLAALLAGAGRFDEADAAYLDALKAYRDVSPFPVAWVAFQRGVMWGEAADRSDRALVLYREAVRRLPGYVVANVHLAELESEVGLTGLAIKRLRNVLDTEDPEPAGLLAELLPEDDAERRPLIEKARSMYEALFEAYPLAFVDHGAEFFMGPGADPQRALSLAKTNLEIRQNDRAWLVGIEAALAAGDTTQACTWAKAAGDGRPSVPLNALRTKVLTDCP
ncbi:MAG: tetratricopeptide repeat protein [Bradymonadia bacterium]